MCFAENFDILVGKHPDQQSFTLPKELFNRRSGFMKAARSDAWIKTPSDITELADFDADIFQSYLQCVYTGKVVATKVFAEAKFDDRCFCAVIRLWVLAEYLNDPATTNLIAHHFVTVAHL